MKILVGISLCCLFAGGLMAQRGGGGHGGGGFGGGGGMHGGGGFGGGMRGGGFGGGMRGGGFGGGMRGGGFGGGMRGGGFGGGFHGGGFRGGGFNGGFRGGGFGGNKFFAHGGRFNRFGFNNGFGFNNSFGFWPWWGFGSVGYWPSWGWGDWGSGWPYYDDSYAYNYPSTGYTGSYAYQTSPNVTVIYPPSDGGSASVPETAHPVIREYDQYGQEVRPGGASGGTAYAGRAPGNSTASASPIYLIAFTDHVIRAASSYWADSRILHYVTLQHEERQAALTMVDRALTMQLNRERNVAFQLPNN